MDDVVPRVVDGGGLLVCTQRPKEPVTSAQAPLRATSFAPEDSTDRITVASGLAPTSTMSVGEVDHGAPWKHHLWLIDSDRIEAPNERGIDNATKVVLEPLDGKDGLLGRWASQGSGIWSSRVTRTVRRVGSSSNRRHSREPASSVSRCCAPCTNEDLGDVARATVDDP